jgi:hypothetical protein
VVWKGKVGVKIGLASVEKAKFKTPLNTENSVKSPNKLAFLTPADEAIMSLFHLVAGGWHKDEGSDGIVIEVPSPMELKLGV